MSKTIDDLKTIPGIIGSLGLAIAEAQKAFDENYLNGLERVGALAKSFTDQAPKALADALAGQAKANVMPSGTDAEKAAKDKAVADANAALTLAQSLMKGESLEPGAFLNTLILTAAPTRYQFTETTLSVKLDLAQRLQITGSAGLGFGFAGIVVNASVSVGFAQDYRAGAEVTTKLQAVLPQNNQDAFKQLLATPTAAVTLSAIPDFDKDVLAAANNVAQMVGINSNAVTQKPKQ